MAFRVTWNSAYEISPADPQAASLGALRIRELKQDVRERLEIDHSMNEDADDGMHLKSTYLEQGGDPTVAANQIGLYAKEGDDAISDLYTKNESGVVHKVTKEGGLGGSEITLDNAEALLGTQVGGSELDLIQMSAADEVEVGHIGASLRLLSDGVTTLNGEALATDIHAAVLVAGDGYIQLTNKFVLMWKEHAYLTSSGAIDSFSFSTFPFVTTSERNIYLLGHFPKIQEFESDPISMKAWTTTVLTLKLRSISVGFNTDLIAYVALLADDLV